MFEDVTTAAGLGSYTGITHGAAWGDFDGDGRPDLYITNHLNEPKLFRNLGNGKFEDVTGAWFIHDQITGDKHGAAWADFDNDGRLDLVQMTGAERGVGSEIKRLFHNTGTRLEDVSEALGTANPIGRTRTPLWVDIDNDGRLDLFEGAEQRFDNVTPPFFFLQRGGKFEAADAAPLASRNVPFCILTRITGGALPDMLCRVSAPDHALQVFATGSVPMKEIHVLPQTAFQDVASGDFDNDGTLDLFMVRKNPVAKVGFGRPASNRLIGDLELDKGNVATPLGFTFKTSGKLSVRVVPAYPADTLTPDLIQLGTGASPRSFTFELSSATPGVSGSPPSPAQARGGVQISMPEAGVWKIVATAPGDRVQSAPNFHEQITLSIESTENISDVTAIGANASSEEAPSRLFMNRDGKLVEESDKHGVNAKLVSGVSVVAGDFDNDMHLDLFVVVATEFGKQENLLLMNRGDGKFDVIPGAGGAAGNSVGVGDTVTTVDYDGDGLLDLLITTGASMGRSLGPASEAGGYQLFHNVTANGNRWLEIDLEGTRSNRNGIGALVNVVAGGVTQTRLQDGGVHNRAQNHMRLHFGLAKNDVANKVTVRWPSGTVQELTNVKANQILRIREP